MRSKLPIWMVPHFMIHVRKFVETLNGKIDMNALPNPFDESSSDMCFLRSSEYVEPTTETEKRLHAIYLEIIRNKIPIEKISIKESIINLGCDSLTVVFLTSKINKEFNIRIDPADYFRVSTIAGCAELIDKISIRL
jgi:acyl carrier protein